MPEESKTIKADRPTVSWEASSGCCSWAWDWACSALPSAAPWAPAASVVPASLLPDEDVPAGVQQDDLLLVVNDDEDSDEEGSRRIDALLARIGTDGSVQLFDGEDWVDMDDMIEDEDDDEDDDDFPFS